jgi:predicted phosphodiesterase
MQRWLLIPDTHRPYHDEKAVKLMLKVAKDRKFDGVVILGDYGDFYGVSSHDKDPNRANRLDEELASINEGLDELDALKFKHKIFVAGNHEDRMERYLKTKAPELFNMVKVKQLLKLQERGWKYVPYKDHTEIGKLFVTHDTGTAGAYAHYKAQADFQSNVVIAHTHRIGYAVIGNARGRPHVGAMLGWLGDVNEVDYMHRVKALKDWALGFGIAYIEPNGHAHVQPVPIIDYKCVVEGKLYKC